MCVPRLRATTHANFSAESGEVARVGRGLVGTSWGALLRPSPPTAAPQDAWPWRVLYRLKDPGLQGGGRVCSGAAEHLTPRQAFGEPGLCFARHVPPFSYPSVFHRK